jgi:hypothetical protein
MTTQMTGNGTVVAAVKAKGWGLLPCPLCGEQQASVHLDLTDLDTFHCADCDSDFSASDVKAFIEKWSKVLAWCEMAPGA